MHAAYRLTSIVRDNIDPVQLRKRLGRHRQKHPPFVLAIHRRIGAALAENALAQNLVLDLAELGFGVGVVEVTVVEVGKDPKPFGVFVGVDEPSYEVRYKHGNTTGTKERDKNAPRTFWHDEGSSGEKRANHALHEERDTPGHVAVNEGTEVVSPLERGREMPS